MLMPSSTLCVSAREEGLTLLVADNPAGYFGVHLNDAGNRIQGKPYEAQVSRGGKTECLGHFFIAEEAALCVADPAGHM